LHSCNHRLTLLPLLLLLQEYCDQGTLGSVAKSHWAPGSEGDEQMLQRLLLLQDCARGLQVIRLVHRVHVD
jgi:hypothetical protein